MEDSTALPLNGQTILQVMHSVIDPELGVNVVDLGLVYSAEASGGDVRIVMTMTTPACPLHSYIKEAGERTIREHFPAVRSVAVEIVWEPKWSPMMMSEEARKQLGWT